MSECDFPVGKTFVATDTTAIGVAIECGRVIHVIDTGNEYRTTQNVVATDIVRDIQKDILVLGPLGLDGTSLQQAYDINQLITTSDANGAVEFQRGTTGGDTDGVAVVKNGAGTNTAVIRGDGTAGFGENSPEGKIHAKNGDAGAITVAPGGDEGVFENDTEAGISIWSGSGSAGNLIFGSTNAGGAGAITYFHNTNLMRFVTNEAVAMAFNSSQHVESGTDNTQTLGTASKRWSEVFAGNATINTSDGREKSIQDENTKVLDAVDSLSIKGFKWNDAIEAKGDSGARIHYGVIAQEVISAFEAQGLDASKYGLVCYDQWEDEYEKVMITDSVQATYDHTGKELTPYVEAVYEDVLRIPAGDRYGVRYEELYALKIACLERKVANL
jgi:hypothetical protein